jgi:hypothetical protein
MGARKQRSAQALATVTFENGQAELRMVVAARNMRGAKKPQIIVVHAEHRIPLEIDARHIRAHSGVV